MKNHSYKLLVADIDGTLVNNQAFISEEDIDALAKVREAGIRVSLSTGRVVQASLKIIDKLSLDGYHVFFDGALVYNPHTHKEIYARPIDKAVIKDASDFVHANKINIDFFSIEKYFIEEESWVTQIRREYFELEPTFINFNRIWQSERIIKGTLVVRSAEEKAKAADFCKKFEGRLSFSSTKTPAYSDVDFINVIAPDVSKGEALEALISHLGVKLDEVAAIGDGGNDAPLLSKAGLAIAMGNAPDKLKAVADHVTEDAEHRGFAKAMKKFIL